METFLVGISFGIPTVLLWMALRLGKGFTQTMVATATALLSGSLFAAGWVMHDAALAGYPLAYAAIPWAGVLWGGALVRIHDNKRLMASQGLIELRIRKLERMEAEMRVSSPGPNPQ